MNAYQLADELDDIDAYEKHQVLLGKASEMLRKQAEEIEYWQKAFDKSMNLNEQVRYLESQVYGGSTK
jgi:predicted HTH domain antitoxin